MLPLFISFRSGKWNGIFSGKCLQVLIGKGQDIVCPDILRQGCVSQLRGQFSGQFSGFDSGQSF